MAAKGGASFVAGDSAGYDNLYKSYAAAYGFDWRLLKAIALQESGENPSAINPSDPAFGLCQILCRADEPDSPCKNKLNVPGWNGATQNRLLDPDFNVSIAAAILASNIGNYGLPKAVAVYNSWGSHSDPSEGPFRNQAYVDGVYARLDNIA